MLMDDETALPSLKRKNLWKEALSIQNGSTPNVSNNVC